MVTYDYAFGLTKTSEITAGKFIKEYFAISKRQDGTMRERALVAFYNMYGDKIESIGVPVTKDVRNYKVVTLGAMEIKKYVYKDKPESGDGSISMFAQLTPIRYGGTIPLQAGPITIPFYWETGVSSSLNVTVGIKYDPEDKKGHL